MRQLPRLDVHSHISPDIAPDELEKLGAVVFIATKSLIEYTKVVDRRDLASVWGVGCHPSLVRAQSSFNSEQFKHAIKQTPYVAEVGLDGDSRVPIGRQEATLRTILSITEQNSRIVSLHSYRATTPLLTLLSNLNRPKGLVLHWWLGNEEETKRALDIGCYFSINFSMMRLSDAWKSMPLERLLIETDHPFGDRFSVAPHFPGSVQDVEAAIARQYGINPYELRRQTWINFARIVKDTDTYELFSKPIQAMIDTVS